MGINDSLQALGNLIHRLLVANFFPLIGTAFTHSFERHAQTFFVVVNIRSRYPFVANVGSQSRVVVGNHPFQFAVLGLAA